MEERHNVVFQLPNSLENTSCTKPPYFRLIQYIRVFRLHGLKKISKLPVRWIASTYQHDTEPRDYQECSQVDEPRVRGMPIPRGCLPKSELIRDFQSELITQLSSVKPSSKLLILFSLRPPLSSNIQFSFIPSGSGASPTFSYTG
ncbi:hypothetical protein AVEN_79061-1 [Araneus ventricosus]|uniref:Uncharacterized protein n=1 Tax=Araneus ventricosus TaxID=182803 RepID=A0A4Y2IHM4_ARAVE|nr:hypothetical protein AVEN_79061-1 [Araneus ventricosus]